MSDNGKKDSSSRISVTETQNPFPNRYLEEDTPKVNRFAPLPTPAKVKSKWLFGIPLVSSLTNQEMDDDTIQSFIDSAISEIEHDLDLYITPVKFRETYDYKRENFAQDFAYIKLDHSPVLNVSSVQLAFSNDATDEDDNVVDFPLEYVYIKPQEGTLQLVPAFGTSISGFLMSAFSGVQYHALQQAGLYNFPGAFRITYTAGFKQDEVPAIIVELAEILASIKILSALGPVFFPQTGVSISIDGTSQSTSTAGSNHFAKRLDDLNKLKEEKMQTVRNYYQKSLILDSI